MPETILIDEPAPHVARITFNRPEVANALSTQMGEELLEAWTSLAARAAGDPGGLRCVILAANGRHFQAGADLNFQRRFAWRRTLRAGLKRTPHQRE